MLCVVLLFCASVVQGTGAYVTPNEGELTRYPLAQSAYFLAHNHLEGRHFDEIEIGDTILYLEGETGDVYEVIEVVSAQASDPLSVYTDLLIDGQWMSPVEVYNHLGFNDQDKLILQTCILKDDNPSWGRLFVIATRRVEIRNLIPYNK